VGLFKVIKVVVLPFFDDGLDIRMLQEGGGTLPYFFVFNKTVADEIFGHFVSLPNLV